MARRIVLKRNRWRDEMMAIKPVQEVIAEHPFLAGLKPAHLAMLSANAVRLSYRPGDVIFREGDPANRFYLIERGKVLLESERRDEPSLPIQVIGSGDVMGWSWLFPPYYWHFDARTLEPTTAICFYGTRLREQCERDHDLGYELMKRMVAVVIQRLQTTRRQFLPAHR